MNQQLRTLALDLIDTSKRVRYKFGADDFNVPLDWSEWKDLDAAIEALSNYFEEHPNNQTQTERKL